MYFTFTTKNIIVQTQCTLPKNRSGDLMWFFLFFIQFMYSTHMHLIDIMSFTQLMSLAHIHLIDGHFDLELHHIHLMCT
jgi:hypothetical protein